MQSRAFIIWCASAGFAAACTGLGSAPSEPSSAAAQPVAALSDSDIPAYQVELLDLAARAASLYPLNPHLRSRARAQESVVSMCLALNQPQRALSLSEQVPDWRRGMAYGAVAIYCAQNDQPQHARRYIGLALLLAEEADGWRSDRVKLKAAQARVLLGETGQPAALTTHVQPSEVGNITLPATADEISFEERMSALDAFLNLGQYDATRNALGSATGLFNHFYEDAQQRSIIRRKIFNSWEPLPIFLRIDLVLQLAEYALGHEDQAGALELVELAQDLRDAARWPLDYGLELSGRLAIARAAAGDEQGARDRIDAALARYEAGRDQIQSMDRAGILRPFAEAFHALHDRENTLRLYRLVVDEGAVNPNARPRANDLVATLGSMAINAVEPDDALRARINEVYERLGDPW